MTTEKVHIGIDIGTTSAKICARLGEKIIVEYKKIYESEESDGNGIQNPKVILETVMHLLKKIEENVGKTNVSDIWTCGQMHGLVMWNQQKTINNLDSLVQSPLYNWTYTTPNLQEFIKTLPKWNCGDSHPGFGLVTLAYLYNKDSNSLKKYNRCGTIMDLFLTLLTHNSDTFISHHNAHSWSFCSSDATWQNDIFAFLPDWIKLPTIISNNSDTIGTLDGDINCHVASGDLQASVASLEYFENTAYIILGTSAQLCCLVDHIELQTSEIPASIVKLPYSKSKKLIAACAMNGGNALENIMKLHSNYYDSNKLHELLDELDKTVPFIPSNLKIDPIFIPERGISKKLSICNINSDTTDIQILEATHQGIINNLFSLFPASLLNSFKIKTLALVGSAQCPRFRRHIEAINKNNFNFIAPNSVISTPFGATEFQTI